MKKQIEPAPEPQVEAVAGSIDAVAGRYSNHIQISVLPEEFVLEFYSRSASPATLVSRIFISPPHAERLYELLGRQIEQRKQQIAELSPGLPGEGGAALLVTKARGRGKRPR